MLWYILIGIVCSIGGIYGGVHICLYTLRRQGLLIEDPKKEG